MLLTNCEAETIDAESGAATLFESLLLDVGPAHRRCSCVSSALSLSLCEILPRRGTNLMAEWV